VYSSLLILLYVGIELGCRGILIRSLGRWICRLFILFDLGIHRALRLIIRPAYEIKGSCDQRGVCCQHIIGDPPRFVKKTWLLRLYAGFHAMWHRFHVVGRGPNDELIFACGHLQTDGRCGIYRYRPRLCRDYPLRPFFGIPKVLPGCGYRVEPRRVAKMVKRPSLRVINPRVAVHHPTPPRRDPYAMDRPEDFHWAAVDDAQSAPGIKPPA
jgi:hypothetical protein